MQHRFNELLCHDPNCEISPLLAFSPFVLITVHAAVEPHNPQLLQWTARGRSTHCQRSPRARLQPDHGHRYWNWCYMHPATRLLHQQQLCKSSFFLSLQVVLITLLRDIERVDQPWVLSHQPQLVVNRWIRQYPSPSRQLSKCFLSVLVRIWL